MAIKTTEEQLEEVQTAISKVMLGQTVDLDGHQITRADLTALTKREETLQSRYNAEQGNFAPRTFAVDGDV